MKLIPRINITDAISKKWRNSRYIVSSGKLLMIAMIIGVLGGLGAVLFHNALEYTTDLVIGKLSGFPEADLSGVIPLIPKWLFFLVPTVGGLLSGILVYTFAPEAEGHGTDAMIDSFHNKGGKVRTRVPFIKAIASIITIGTGGSAGYEGPTAQIGSGFGSIISKLLKVPEKMGRLLLLAGTAAGLGAIFRAPLGGALTSVEVIYKEDFESEGFLPCIVASVVAYATFMQVTGAVGALFDLPGLSYNHTYELVFFAIFGVLCAPVSWLFVKSFYFTIATFRKFKIPNHFKPAIGGLGVGLIAYICPQAIGGGWQYLHDAISGEFTILFLLVIAGLKIVTTSLTVGSGGSGGVFGPSLFIGGMLGGFFGYGLDFLFPHMISNPAAYVLVGMGAFFAGAANAPIASIIMVCEITGNYALLAPLMLASIIHIMLAKRWSIYKNQKANKFDSPAHQDEMNTDVLRSIQIGSIVPRQHQVVTVHQYEHLSELKWLIGETEVETYPVLDDNGRIVGLLSLHQLRQVILETSAQHLVIVEDMMTEVFSLRKSFDLHFASQIFLRSKHTELPVVDEEGNIQGLLKYQDILMAYDEYLDKLD
ncbi:MAG: chloride channel protein [Fibrobacteria bacterium]|nr:chloride channel protein [Fibrobacteria bacterium]